MHLFDHRKLFQSFADGGASIVDRVPSSLQKLINQNWSVDINNMKASKIMNQNRFSFKYFLLIFSTLKLYHINGILLVKVRYWTFYIPILYYITFLGFFVWATTKKVIVNFGKWLLGILQEFRYVWTQTFTQSDVFLFGLVKVLSQTSLHITTPTMFVLA